MSRSHFSTRALSSNGPARALAAVIPNDAADLPKGLTRALFVGGAGAVVVVDAEGAVVTIASAAHQYHPIEVARVRATGTTATDIVALY